MEFQTIHLLLLEDSPADIRAISMMLENSDIPFEIETSSTLKKGKDLVKGNQFDIVLLDLNLEDSRGVDTFLKLYSVVPETPIIVFTGTEDEELAYRAMDRGAQDYLVKGEVDMKVLVRSIKYALIRHKLRIQLKQMSKELKESEARFRILIERSTDGVLIIDSNKIIHYSNPAAEEIFNKSEEELIGTIFEYSLDTDKSSSTIEVVNDKNDIGTVSMRVMKTELKGVNFYIVTLNDITEFIEQARLEEELREMTIKDELTELYNRRGFKTIAEQLLKVSSFTKHNMIVFFIDMDNLKYINDNFSHEIGDNAIISVAGILKKTFRDSDIIARYGGDEFVIIARHAGRKSLDNIILRLRENVEQFNSKSDSPYDISISIGMAFYEPESPLAIDELIREADESMYQEKHRKHND